MKNVTRKIILGSVVVSLLMNPVAGMGDGLTDHLYLEKTAHTTTGFLSGVVERFSQQDTSTKALVVAGSVAICIGAGYGLYRYFCPAQSASGVVEDLSVQPNNDIQQGENISQTLMPNNPKEEKEESDSELDSQEDHFSMYAELRRKKNTDTLVTLGDGALVKGYDADDVHSVCSAVTSMTSMSTYEKRKKEPPIALDVITTAAALNSNIIAMQRSYQALAADIEKKRAIIKGASAAIEDERMDDVMREYQTQQISINEQELDDLLLHMKRFNQLGVISKLIPFMKEEEQRIILKYDSIQTVTQLMKEFRHDQYQKVKSIVDRYPAILQEISAIIDKGIAELSSEDIDAAEIKACPLVENTLLELKKDFDINQIYPYLVGVIAINITVSDLDQMVVIMKHLDMHAEVRNRPVDGYTVVFKIGKAVLEHSYEEIALKPLVEKIKKRPDVQEWFDASSATLPKEIVHTVNKKKK